MQQPDSTDAPLVPLLPDQPSDQPLATDGGDRRPPERAFDRPPSTDHATEYTRDDEEIEPFVVDLR